MEKHIASDCQSVDEAAKQVRRPPTSPQDLASFTPSRACY